VIFGSGLAEGASKRRGVLLVEEVMHWKINSLSQEGKDKPKGPWTLTSDRRKKR